MSDWTKRFDDSFWLLRDDMPEEQARFIRRALGLRRGSQRSRGPRRSAGQRVLDVPCGAGRTSLALAKLGLDITGVDLRAKFINRAKRRFRKEGLPGTFLVGDMRELELKGDFHAVVNWCGSFGYYDEAVNLDILRRLVRVLRPGGRLLIDTHNREAVLRRLVAEETMPLTTAGGNRGGTLTKRSRWNPRYQRIERVWTLRRGRREIASPMCMRLYTPAQYRELFERTGLVFEAIYGSWTGGAYSRTSRRLVVVGRKPS